MQPYHPSISYCPNTCIENHIRLPQVMNEITLKFIVSSVLIEVSIDIASYPLVKTNSNPKINRRDLVSPFVYMCQREVRYVTDD